MTNQANNVSRKKSRNLIGKVFREIQRIFSLITSKNYQFLRFSAPGHFYSPIPDISEIHSNADTLFDKSIKDIPGVDLNDSGQLKLAQNFTKYYGDIRFSKEKKEGARYYYHNEYFCYGDSIALYSMMRHFEPKQIFEVGSGFSSAAMLDTDDQFLGGKTRFTFIEPYAARLYSLLTEKDKERCKIIEKPVQTVSPEEFRVLDKNDILFIDSSHIGKIHSDFLHLILNVLPALKPGVIIHFHDIFWPLEYPMEWLDEGKAFNEAYFLRTFLQYNNQFEVLYFNSYMEYHHADFLKNNLPQMVETPPPGNIAPSNSSLWIRKIS